ncbi:MAG: hypothetical protein JO127_00435 [Caulobacteraceae bacterium]|nr:hypothetical protein [Caulobacteraceae bacterium]
MSSDTTTGAAAEAAAAKNSVKDAARSALETGQRGLNEALEHAERSLNEAARRAEKALREGVEALKAQTEGYRADAGEQFDQAQKYVLERVKERPVTATLAGLGVGLLLGLLLANRSSK